MVAAGNHLKRTPRWDCPKHRMQEVELVPFRAAIAAGCKAIMTGHSVYPAYDDKYPTTLSARICSRGFFAWASSTDLMTPARNVSFPVFVTLKTNVP